MIEMFNMFNTERFNSQSLGFIDNICANGNKAMNFNFVKDEVTYIGAIAIKVYKNGGLINQFIFYPTHDGKIESISIFGLQVHGHKESIENSMKIFGLPVESVEVDNMNDQDFLEVTLEDYNF
jgi:hypothetical protein